MRIHVPVGVSYSSDVEKVRKTLIEVAKNTDFVLKNRKIEARFIEFGDNSLNFELLVWINVKGENFINYINYNINNKNSYFSKFKPLKFTQNFI